MLLKTWSGNLIVRVGGPAYRIGMGGSASSNQDTENEELDYDGSERRRTSRK